MRVSIYFHPVGSAEIIGIVKKLKNSYHGLHDVPCKILKLAINYLSMSISHIVNQSIVQGIFPDVLKKAIITPVHKSGSKQEISNYRPISVLPLLSKIFERCIYNRIVSFVRKHNLLSGFSIWIPERKKHYRCIIE